MLNLDYLKRLGRNGTRLGWRVLKGQRRLPVPAALHLILGGAGLQAFAMLRRGAPDGTVLPQGALGDATGLLLVCALLSGLLLSILARHLRRGSMTALLLGHGLIGACGLALLAAWAARL